MDWKVIAALSVLGVALLAGLAIAIVSSVNSYAKRFAEGKEDTRRGFEVKSTTTGTEPAVQREKDDHHG
jgi:hypothetical protein